MRSLTIIVPVYNEVSFLGFFWNQLRSAPIDRCSGIEEVEILVVDDGSTDGSTETLKSLVEETSEFFYAGKTRCTKRLLRHEKNLGKGAAVRTGIQASTGDVVLIQDADAEYSPQDFPRILEPILQNVADAIIGSRFAGYPRRVMYYWNTAANRLVTWFANMLFDTNLTDLVCGYKVIRGELARSLRLTSPRFSIEAELVARLAKAKARIYEVPIQYYGRTRNEGKKVRAVDGVSMLFHTLKYSLWDTEAFKPGLYQTLWSLDALGKLLYVPALSTALGAASANRNLRLLEIGAGIGTLTSVLLRYGEVVASDISVDYVGKIRERFRRYGGFSAEVWDATTPVPEHWGKFDRIVAFNVLEHLEKDAQALEYWAEALSERGEIILLVPQYPKLFNRIDAAIGHYRRYTRSSLREVLEQAKLQPRQEFLTNAIGIPGWWLQGRVFRKESLDRGKLRLYAILAKVLGPLEKLLRKTVGLSLVCVAKRAPDLAEAH